jgi:hypothetical protein
MRILSCSASNCRETEQSAAGGRMLRLRRSVTRPKAVGREKPLGTRCHTRIMLTGRLSAACLLLALAACAQTPPEGMGG